MDPDLVSSTLFVRLQERTIEEMVLGANAESALSDHNDELFRDLISKIYKEEQICENAMATREENSKQIDSLLAVTDIEKVGLAKELLKEKEMLIRKKAAVQSALSAENINVVEFLKQRSRVKPLDGKISRVQQLTENCNRLRTQIAEYSSNLPDSS